MANHSTGVFDSFDDISDPRLRKIAVRAYNILRMSAHRVAAHHDDPKNYPLPADPNSLEGVLAARFRKLRPASQSAAVAKAMRTLRAPEAARVKAYGEMGRLAVNKAVALETQAIAMPLPADMKFDLASLKTMMATPESRAKLLSTDGGLAPQAANDNLELRIRRVHCLAETSELGNDEIKLGGTSVDETGESKLIAPFMVSDDFSDGETKFYNPPRKFTGFSLREGGDHWPKSYFVTFALAEEDEGGFGDFLKSLLDKVKGVVAPLLGTAVGTALGSLIPIPGVGPLLGALGGFLIGSFIGWIADVWNDDVFIPITVHATIKSLNHQFASGKSVSDEHWVGWKQHGGHYRLFYDWVVHP